MSARKANWLAFLLTLLLQYLRKVLSGSGLRTEVNIQIPRRISLDDTFIETYLLTRREAYYLCFILRGFLLLVRLLFPRANVIMINTIASQKKLLSHTSRRT